MKLIQKSVLFTLFHHDITYQNKTFEFDTKHLYIITKEQPKYKIEDIADKLYFLITEYINGYKNSEVSITLTGGMDSRIILAALLKAGVKPNCMAYGNSDAIDIVLARKIAKKFGLSFHNACANPPEKEWYYKWVIDTILKDNGNAHLHRAHRNAAIAEHAEIYSPKVLLTGHMGGEGLRGFTYNNYIASSFFEMINKGKRSPLKDARGILSDYFLKTENIDYDALMKSLQKLTWLKNDRKTNEFFFLYDLVAKIHHAQDIRLYQSYVPKVLPVFLQKQYLEILFASPYNILAKKNNLLNRLKNPEFYCRVIKELYPPLLDIPFANNFTPQEYLRGLWYYVPLKLYRDYTHKKKYAHTFSYGKWYVDFVKEYSQNITSEIWEIYDKNRYMEALENNNHCSDEGYWHKFSNPIFFDLVRKHKNGKI